MKFLSVAVLSLAGLAMAKGHEKASNGTMTNHHDKAGNGTAGGKHHGQSAMAQCREVARLTNLMELAANQTRLDKVAHNNATKEEAIKSKASAAASTLSALQANATLMATCNQVFAVDQMRESCAKMAAMEHLETLVANATRLSEVTKNNATKADALKAKASADASALASLQGNATLTQFCSVETTRETCRAMNQMQKTVAEAANSTWLEAHFKGNETKITAFKDRAAKEQTKLAALQGNSTLTSACSALGCTFCSHILAYLPTLSLNFEADMGCLSSQEQDRHGGGCVGLDDDDLHRGKQQQHGQDGRRQQHPAVRGRDLAGCGVHRWCFASVSGLAWG
jgi:hypothetical protein